MKHTGDRLFIKLMRYIQTVVNFVCDLIYFFFLRRDADGYWVARGAEDAQPASNTVFFIHGGGFCVPVLTGKYATLATLKRYSNCRFYHATYSLCPDVGLEEILVQVWSQYKAVHEETGGNVVVMGDSCGGCLALLVKLRAMEEQEYTPKGVVLLSPWLNVLATRYDLPSYEINAKSDMIPWRFYDAISAITAESSTSVETLEDLLKRCSGLADTLIVAGQVEIARDEAVALYLAAGGDDGETELYLGDEAAHDYMVTPGACKKEVFDETWSTIATRIKIFFGDFEEDFGDDAWVEVDEDSDGERSISDNLPEEEEEEEEEEDDDDDDDEKSDAGEQEDGFERVREFVSNALKQNSKRDASKAKSKGSSGSSVSTKDKKSQGASGTIRNRRTSRSRKK